MGGRCFSGKARSQPNNVDNTFATVGHRADNSLITSGIQLLWHNASYDLFLRTEGISLLATFIGSVLATFKILAKVCSVFTF